LFADHIKSSPSPSARHHHGNIPRCENSDGPEKTDGNSQEQAAVWHTSLVLISDRDVALNHHAARSFILSAESL
jgi:hypothetical protein